MLAENCGSYWVKTTCFTFSGDRITAYLKVPILYNKNYEDGGLIFNYFNEQHVYVQSLKLQNIHSTFLSEIDTNELSPVLAINKKIFNHEEGIEAVDSNYIIIGKSGVLRFSDSVCTKAVDNSMVYALQWEGEEDGVLNLLPTDQWYSGNLFYGKGQSIRVDSLAMITLDSILWCDDYQQFQMVEDGKFNAVQKKERWHLYFSELIDEFTWIEFYGFSEEWTKDRFIEVLNPATFSNRVVQKYDEDLILYFPPILQDAIRSNEIIYFVRSTP